MRIIYCLKSHIQPITITDGLKLIGIMMYYVNGIHVKTSLEAGKLKTT